MIRHTMLSSLSPIRNRTSGKLCISLVGIVYTSGRLYTACPESHIRPPCTIIGIVHPEGFTSAHQKSKASGCLFRNFLPSGCASGCLVLTILVVPKGAGQRGYEADASEATE